MLSRCQRTGACTNRVAAEFLRFPPSESRETRANPFQTRIRGPRGYPGQAENRQAQSSTRWPALDHAPRLPELAAVDQGIREIPKPQGRNHDSERHRDQGRNHVPNLKPSKPRRTSVDAVGFWRNCPVHVRRTILPFSGGCPPDALSGERYRAPLTGAAVSPSRT